MHLLLKMSATSSRCLNRLTLIDRTPNRTRKMSTAAIESFLMVLSVIAQTQGDGKAKTKDLSADFALSSTFCTTFPSFARQVKSTLRINVLKLPSSFGNARRTVRVCLFMGFRFRLGFGLRFRLGFGFSFPILTLRLLPVFNCSNILAP
jgi:hypothetical protein